MAIRVLRFLTSRGGLALIVAMALAGGSITYALTRTTSELPGSFVAVEATYGLSIMTGDHKPLLALAFGEVVQGEIVHKSFVVKNDGNSRITLGFRVKTGDGQSTTYASTGSCALTGLDTHQTRQGFAPLFADQLHRAHRDFHTSLGGIDSLEERERHEKFHQELGKKLRSHKTGIKRLHQIQGQAIDVPGLARFCFVVAPPHNSEPILLAPGSQLRVVAELRTDPDVPQGLQQFTILVDAHDLAE